MEDNVLVHLENIGMFFYQKDTALHVLNDIDLSLHKGEIIALLGPSGGGKSTILNIISGLLTPTSGKVERKGEIGYMFQRDQLLDWRNIYDNILLGLEIQKSLTTVNQAKVDRLLQTYGLWDFRMRYPRELSGGMRQRVALIRTLAVDPDILLLDEPFSSLDYQTRLLVSNDIYQIIKQEHKSTILVTHDINEAVSMADTVYVLSPRPAAVKAIHPIELTTSQPRTPILSRKAVEFQPYVDLIWKEMIQNEADQPQS